MLEDLHDSFASLFIFSYHLIVVDLVVSLVSVIEKLSIFEPICVVVSSDGGLKCLAHIIKKHDQFTRVHVWVLQMSLCLFGLAVQETHPADIQEELLLESDVSLCVLGQSSVENLNGFFNSHLID